MPAEIRLKCRAKGEAYVNTAFACYVAGSGAWRFSGQLQKRHMARRAARLVLKQTGPCLGRDSGGKLKSGSEGLVEVLVERVFAALKMVPVRCDGEQAFRPGVGSQQGLGVVERRCLIVCGVD